MEVKDQAGDQGPHQPFLWGRGEQEESPGDTQPPPGSSKLAAGRMTVLWQGSEATHGRRSPGHLGTLLLPLSDFQEGEESQLQARDLRDLFLSLCGLGTTAVCH